MSNDLELLLRKALDETDRYQRRVLRGAILLGAATCALLLWLEHISRTTDVKGMLPFVVAVLLVGQVAPAVVTWGRIADSTRKILKAIELTQNDR
jgi:hypothetical protein